MCDELFMFFQQFMTFFASSELNIKQFKLSKAQQNG